MKHTDQNRIAYANAHLCYLKTYAEDHRAEYADYEPGDRLNRTRHLCDHVHWALWHMSQLGDGPRGFRLHALVRELAWALDRIEQDGLQVTYGPVSIDIRPHPSMIHPRDVAQL
jgi:hypothetical protein